MKYVLALLLSTICFPVMAATGVSVDSLVSVLIYIIVIGLVFWLLWWLVSYIGLPEPFNKVARVILAIAAVLVVLNLLLGFAGHPILTFR